MERIAQRIAQIALLMVLTVPGWTCTRTSYGYVCGDYATGVKLVGNSSVLQETYTAYQVHSYSFDPDKNVLTWNLSTRKVDPEGNTLGKLLQKVTYTLNLETGEIASPKTTGVIDVYVHTQIWRELLHMKRLLVNITDILHEENPLKKDVRVSR